MKISKSSSVSAYFSQLIVTFLMFYPFTSLANAAQSSQAAIGWTLATAGRHGAQAPAGKIVASDNGDRGGPSSSGMGDQKNTAQDSSPNGVNGVNGVNGDNSTSGEETLEEAPSEASIVLDDESVPDEEEKSEGVFGATRIGALVSLGIPDVLRFSLDLKIQRRVGISLGFAKFKSRINDIGVSINHFDVTGKWFPFEGNMYVGLGLGKNTYRGDLKKTINFVNAKNQPSKAETKFKASVNRTDIKPMIGWQWISSPGFTLDLAFGWSIAMNTSSSLEDELVTSGLSTADQDEVKTDKDYSYHKKKVQEDFVDRYKAKGIGHVSLGFGWML